jgi:uncharacterized heparinase superfamily protein
MKRAIIYFHTLRHLKWAQVAWRLWYKMYRPVPDVVRAPERRQCAGIWQRPVAPEPTMLGPGTFFFLNQTGALGNAAAWNDPAAAKLWLYNLHYFDDLNARDGLARAQWHRHLVSRWVAENPPGVGNGWEPYPASLRIVNWIKWALSGASLESDWLDSLATQAQWLHRRPEYHLLGNHLLANAKALVFAGLFFEGKGAQKWFERGLSILARELPEQVLADGGHCERSPMYHLLVLEDVLDLINIHAAYKRELPPEWVDAGERMLAAMPAMVHPDGEIALFNDAAIGIAPPPIALREYAERLNLNSGDVNSTVATLPETGYYRIGSGPAVCLVDVAPIGPDYLPGHAHADTLSFELSLDGLRFFVNSGTSVYGTGRERLRQRGTATHNTVVVDGEESSEVWSGFRVARRAYPFGVDWGSDKDALWLRGAHDGYRRLARNQVHRRSWQLKNSALTVADELGERFSQASAYFHLHPNVEVMEADARGARLRSPSGREVKFRARGGAVHVEPSTYHPEFGMTLTNQQLVVNFQRQEIECRITW